MNKGLKKEIVVPKVELLSRKIASIAISRVPREYIAPDGRKVEQRIVAMTDSLSESIIGILESHHEELMDYLALGLMKSDTISVSYKTRIALNSEIPLETDRLSALLKSILNKWKNIPAK